MLYRQMRRLKENYQERAHRLQQEVEEKSADIAHLTQQLCQAKLCSCQRAADDPANSGDYRRPVTAAASIGLLSVPTPMPKPPPGLPPAHAQARCRRLPVRPLEKRPRENRPHVLRPYPPVPPIVVNASTTASATKPGAV